MNQNSLSAVSLTLLAAIAGFAQSSVPLNTTPSRVVGHPLAEQNSITSVSPNLVEGRELFAPQGIALDTSVTPPILYIADTFNNRVLAWQNAAAFGNGQIADLVIGQGTSGTGQDFYHTLLLGPATAFTSGLALPTGLAVSNGDLYIADSGNNRILRFRKPFANAGNLFPDLYIGQPSLNARAVNYTGQVDAKGLNLQGFQVALAFDGSGNLWLSDAGNARVLRFAAADLAAGGGPLTANLVIGQLTFTSIQAPVTPQTRNVLNAFAIPGALAFDPSGRLYVSDTDGSQNLDRVLVFGPGFSNGMSASRAMGVLLPLPNNQTYPQEQILKTVMWSPGGIFFIPGASQMGVVDTNYNRIMLFDSYENWPDPNTTFSPLATGVVGQLTFSAIGANGGIFGYTPPPTAQVLNAPTSAVFVGNELYIVDTGNHRVIVMPFQNGSFGSATRVLGQDLFDMMQPNLIEGREFSFRPNPYGGGADAGLAIDATGDTPHLYVADTYNNRVLGFNDFRKVGPGSKADLVIGQGDLKHGLCNQIGDPFHPNATTLCLPTSLVVDSNGNLYVADTGNSRVLRFPAPYSHQGLEQADLVLGQHNMTTIITDPSAFTMASPTGLAFAGNNGLLVADSSHNRVLFFPFTNGGFDPTADSGKAATKVFGQPDFTTITPGTGLNKMNGPYGISADTSARPYVVDNGNNRVLIFDQINSDQNGATAVLTIPNLSSPRGIYVTSDTGESWITDTNNLQVKKYAKFDTLITNQVPEAAVQSAGATLAVVQDPFGALVVADTTNRVGFYYPGLQGINGASFLGSRPLAPGTFASICSPGSNCDPKVRASYLGANTANAADLPNPLPLPTALGDVLVLFNGVPVPLYYVSPSQINFYVPMGAPTSGTADVVVEQASTGRIYANGPVAMNTSSPAILLQTFTGTDRAASVTNQDFSVNTPTNPASRCSVITIYATGQGFVPNAPPDGSPATSSPLLTTPSVPRVNFGGLFTDQYPKATCDPAPDQFVQFSGLAPGYVGLWQINVFIPGNVAPASQVRFFIQMGSLASGDGTYFTDIAVK
ncbi:MAG TPA: hypothetical protein VE959_27915 [Bryobacteraceae bacterium]|nr:hypothetical protein [Bryobacteraceae bacterium]